MSDHFRLSAAEMRALQALLREIPDVVEDLAIQLTGQAVTGAQGSKRRRGDEQPLPFHLGASEAHELLNETLTAWTMHLTQHFAIPFAKRKNTLTLARFLHDHVTQLAMLDGSEDAHDEIAYAIRECRRACDRPNDRAILRSDPMLVTEARSLELNARGCVQIARQLGPKYRECTQARIKYLTKVKALVPVRQVRISGTLTNIYLLGDVLEATKTEDDD